MAGKLKRLFCYDTSIIGKLSEALVKIGISAEITIDTRQLDEVKTYCWCCALWRGVALGAVVGFLVGVLL